ncbi:MAG TPA: 2-oxoacid:ferredoxin oxidoreductase subunit beta [Actinomycetota bacterium]|nr:2-oxoacid:ferredoxin oxidoreductase subunit beta [Actinomycetota bacterium]
MSDGNGGVSAPVEVALTKKDYTSDQDVRWCPGCGDYAVLATVQSYMPELQIPKEKTVFISGIGCSSRFPYYMNTYGFHSIHGRAPAIASGLAVTNPELDIWVVTGDGDALSIGGNHLIHLMRRNVNLTVLLFNNQIYGLTKGQYSPTSEMGKVTKSTPFGSTDYPFNPISLALGAECSFVARSIDSERAHLLSVLRRAAQHKGTRFIEIYQNCNIFNDDAFIALTGRQTKQANQIRLEHGKPIRFGVDDSKGVVADGDGALRIVDVQEVGEDRLVVHDEGSLNAAHAFSLSRLAHSPTGPTPIGVFRAVERPTYEDMIERQISDAQSRSQADLASLLASGDTWTVG